METSCTRKRRRVSENMVPLLQGRETGAPMSRCGNRWRFRCRSRKARFRHFKLKAHADTYEAEATAKIEMPFLRRRSAIIEVVAADSLVLALTQTGVCGVFACESLRPIGYLNVVPDEIIRSLFYNKCNRSIITVCVYRRDNFSSLRCRSTKLSDIVCGRTEHYENIFESETLHYPGFVEFDEVNSIILTYSAGGKPGGCYTAWSMESYTPLYKISGLHIKEVKISLGVLLLIQPRTQSHLPLQLLDIKTGEHIKSFKHLLHRKKEIEIVEQFNEKLLIKQRGENLVIYDVRTGSLLEVPRTEFTTPSAFIFLHESQLFLTFCKSNIAVWNFSGQIVTRFKDHKLFSSECQTNNVFISHSQDLIVSYCSSDNDPNGSINVSSILSGELLGKVSSGSGSDFDSRRARALTDVNSLFLCETTNTLYTGTQDGCIHAWGT